ncbi:MAG: polyprenyl synthetase family protein [Clostridiales bacterium]|nr:polyprenyl synthetase family protein [Clostridiales bacterium]
MSEKISFFMKKYQDRIEGLLPLVFPAELSEDPTVAASMYSLLAGGKRIRPVLMYMVAEMLCVELSVIDDFAAAMEMVHTYSLIHDDLPCMDNDTLRRGKPTCHVAHGEAYALLAGDALLNRAFERVLLAVNNNPHTARAAVCFSENTGICGMIGGQSIDLASEGKKIDTGRLCELHEKKTGALINASCLIPYYIYAAEKGEDKELYDLIHRFSAGTGLGFQIKDDLLDVQADASVLGKSTGKDERDQKSTFVTVFGEKSAQQMLDDTYSDVFESLDELAERGWDVSELREFSELLLNRVQ